MTKKELNRDIKRMAKLYNEANLTDHNGHFYEGRDAKVEKVIKEFKRLYSGGSNFEYLNATSLRILIKITYSLEIHLYYPSNTFTLGIKDNILKNL